MNLYQAKVKIIKKVNIVIYSIESVVLLLVYFLTIFFSQFYIYVKCNTNSFFSTLFLQLLNGNRGSQSIVNSRFYVIKNTHLIVTIVVYGKI